MAQSGSVGELLRQAWSRRHPSHPEWASHLEPGHVQKSIMRIVAGHPWVLLAELPLAGDPGRYARPDHMLPRTGAPVPQHLLDRTRRWIADDRFWAVVTALGTIANAQVMAVERYFAELDPAARSGRTRRPISEWACALVVRPYGRAPAIPSPEFLDEERSAFCGREIELVARTRYLPTGAQFVARFSEDYAAMWARHGDHPPPTPIELGLGALLRPPMTGRDNDWWTGTDRSVQQRYQYLLRARWSTDPESVTESAGLDMSRHISVRLPAADPEVVCRDVLVGARSPLGLRFAGHRALVTAVSHGVWIADLESAHARRDGGGPPLPGGSGLADWGARADDLPDVADPELVDAVRDNAEYWANHSRVAAEFVWCSTRYRTLHWPTQVQRGVSRKLWHQLHCREAEWNAPLRRTEATTLIPKMFQSHLRSLLERQIPDPEQTQHDDDRQTPEPPPVVVDDPRWLSTQGRLAQDAERTNDMCALMGASDRGWQAVYRVIVAGHESECLTLAEFADYAVRNFDAGTGGGS